MAFFDRTYPRLIFWGLIAAVWFAALFEAAHNVWAASLLFGELTILGVIFCIGRFRDKKPIRLPLIGSLALLLLAFRLSLWQASDVETAWLEFWGWTFTILMFYLFVNVVESDRDLDRFLSWAGAVVLPLVMYCIWQRFGLPDITAEGLKPTVRLFGYGYLEVPLSWIAPGQTWRLRYGHWEIHASLINSVVMAGFTLYWTLFYAVKSLKDRRWLFLALSCAALLMFARSASALIALGLGAAVYARNELTAFARSHRKLTALAAAALFGLLMLLVYMKWHHGVERIEDAGYYNASSRGFYWMTALHMLERFPWTGVGLGGYATAFPLFKVGSVENTLFAHGLIPQMAAETGVFGLLALAILLGNVFRLCLTDRTQPTPMRRVLDATLIAVLGFSVLSINMDFLLNKFTFFLLLGATLTTRTLRTYSVQPLWMGVAAGSLLLGIALWLNLFAASRLYTEALYCERQGDVLRAIKLYHSAIEVESFHSDSYWRLSRLYAASYKKTRAPEELHGARMYLQQALRYKKDVRYVKDLETLK